MDTLESENQIVFTTHNPLFINRHSVGSNIIVDIGKAIPAKNIKMIRDVLGVRVSDNLTHARYTLVVEGNEDRKALLALLPELSSKLGNAIRQNNMIIDPIGGAGNLSYKLSTLKAQLCLYHVLLDNDQSANTQRDKAINDGLLSLKGLTQTICNGMSEAEFEDCIEPSIYQNKVSDEFGVNLNCAKFRCNKKWSDRVKDCFQDQGKPWSDKIKVEVKDIVAKCIVAQPNNALNAHKRSSLDGLVRALEELVK